MLKNLINYLDSISPLALLFFGLVTEKIDWRRDSVAWFLGLQVILNGFSSILSEMRVNNLYIYHVNCALSFLILSFFFGSVLHFKRIKPIIIVVLGLFLLIFLLNIVKWEDLGSFNSNTFGLASLILTTYCLLYYLNHLTQPTPVNITKSKHFWYVTGIFTYYASSFFIFTSYRVLTQNNTRNLGVLWQIHNVIFVIMCVYILVGVLCKSSLENYKL